MNNESIDEPKESVMRKLCLTLMGLALYFVTGCSEKPADMSTVAKAMKTGKFHGDTMSAPAPPPSNQVLNALKKRKLNGYQQQTIGAAFDTYSKVANREWREELGKDGKYYVDFFCWFPGMLMSASSKAAGVEQQGLNVKFAIQEDGNAYVTLGQILSRMPDGKIVSDIIPMSEMPKVLNAIYTDRELIF